jgi:hypothetical protein
VLHCTGIGAVAQDPRSYFQMGDHSRARVDGPAVTASSRDSMQGIAHQLRDLKQRPLCPGMSDSSVLAVLMEASQGAPQQNGSTSLPASQLGQSLLVGFTFL